MQKGDRVKIRDSAPESGQPDLEGEIVSDRPWNGCWHVRVDGLGRWPFDVPPSQLEAI